MLLVPGARCVVVAGATMGMKGFLGVSLSCAVFVLSASYGWRAQGTADTKAQPGVRVPVVLELFTSEGCSSCPPADALLAKMEEQQPVSGAEIIALEEHVDYWDQQGWVDPFSSGQWTQRQQIYAYGFGDHSVYTPELVVNGRAAFVGSHEGDAYRAVMNAAAQPRTVMSITVLPSEKRDHARVKIEIGKLQGAQAGDAAEVWVAITETALHSAVAAGENSGHDLHHAAVVRWLRKTGAADSNGAATFTGESDVKLESGWKRANLRVVAFVQEKRSRHILGAASVRIEPNAPS
jgi:hypothetical protein